jgi:tetratricopeptide (TPR) repeat protein
MMVSHKSCAILIGMVLVLSSCRPGGLVPIPAHIITVPLPTNTIRRTPTSSPTATLKNVTARVFIATPTPTLTPTASATFSTNLFKPGDPTATPLGSEITDPNYLEGLKAYKEKKYQELVRLMSAVINANPDLAPPYRYRGFAYWSLNKCENGLADVEKAISLNPDYAHAWVIRGLLGQCLGNEEQMLRDYQKALSLDPSLSVVHHNLGVYYFHFNDFERSLEEYSLSREIDPTRAYAWAGMSEALERLGRFDECIQTATRAIEIDNKLWLAYADRGLCYLAKDLNVQAVADYKVYVANEKPFAEDWYNYGIALRHSNDPRGAIIAYAKALELKPSYSQAYINRGMAYLDLQDYNNALKDFNHALEFGDIPMAYSGRGKVYYEKKQYELAVKDFEKSIALYPFDAFTFCNAALSYFEVGRFQDALDAAETSNQLNPACGGLKLKEVQARSYYELGEYNQALQYINMALEASKYSLGYYYRGIIFQASGRKNEAIQDLEVFLSAVKTNGYKGPEVQDAKARFAKLKT